MNTNLKSCPKCGHSANDTAATCAYCGAVLSAEDPSLQTDKITPVEATPFSEQTPLMQPDEPIPDITRTEEPANTVAAVVEWLEPDDSDSPPAADSAGQASEPINEPAPIKTEHESAAEFSDPSQVIESNQEVSPTTSESRVDNHQVAAQDLEQEPIPGHVPESEAKTADLSDNTQQDIEELVEIETAAEPPRSSPESDILESGDTEPLETADLGHNSHQETEKPVEIETAAEPPRSSPESHVLESGNTEPLETADLSDNDHQDTKKQVETETVAEQPRLSPVPDVLKSGENEPSETTDLSDSDHQNTEKQVETETAAEQPRLSPVPDVLKSGENEPSETATPEQKQSEWTKFEAPAGSDSVLSFDEAVAETQTDKVQDTPPTEADEPTTEPPAVLEYEAPEEAILLPLDEIVQPLAKDTPDGVGERAGEVAETTTGTSTTEAKSDILPSQDKVQTEPEAIPKKAKVQSVPTVLKIEKAAQELAEAVKKQKAALAEARALKKQKLMRAKAQALKRKEETLSGAQALKKQKEIPAGIKISKKGIAAQSISKTESPQRRTTQGLKAHTKMQALLKKYANQAIGINYDNSADIKAAELVEVNDEFFSVSVKHDTLLYSYPLNTILAVIEGKDGVGPADPEKRERFNAVIKVYSLVLS